MPFHSKNQKDTKSVINTLNLSQIDLIHTFFIQENQSQTRFQIITKKEAKEKKVRKRDKTPRKIHICIHFFSIMESNLWDRHESTMNLNVDAKLWDTIHPCESKEKNMPWNHMWIRIYWWRGRHECTCGCSVDPCPPPSTWIHMWIQGDSCTHLSMCAANTQPHHIPLIHKRRNKQSQLDPDPRVGYLCVCRLGMVFVVEMDEFCVVSLQRSLGDRLRSTPTRDRDLPLPHRFGRSRSTPPPKIG